MPLPGLGRLSFIGNSSGPKRAEQAHTRVIVRHWPFWASTPGFRDHPGRIMVPASPGSASGAHLRGSHLGSDVGEQNLVPVRVIALSKTIPIDAPGSGGLSRARRDEITRVAARGVHGLQNGFHRRPARQVQAGVIYGRRAGRVALGARTGVVSCHTSWPDACARVGVWFWTDARAADSSAAVPRQSASEVSRSAWPGSPSWSASGAVANPSLSPQVRRCSVIQFLPRHGGPSMDGGPGTREAGRSAWNGTEGSGRKRRPADAQAETLGSAGPGFPKGGLPAFHVEPNGPGWAVALRLGSAERGRMMLTVLLCAASSARRLRFLRGWRGSAGTTARERLRRQRLYFLAGLDRSFRIGNSEWIFGVDRATWESLRVVVPSGHPGLGFGDGCPCADPCSEGSHDPPVSVGEMRTHDPH